ncbi:sensor histidine kinase [Glutamicibacter sp. X7]
MSPTSAETRAPLVAAMLICAIGLPLSIAALLQLAEPAGWDGVVPWIGALAVALHLAGFLCVWFPRAGFGLGALLMLALALAGDLGSSSAALLPSAVTFLLLQWQLATTQPRPTALTGLGVGLLGALLITAVDAISYEQRDLMLLAFEATALAAVVGAAWFWGRSARRRRAAVLSAQQAQIRQAIAAERTRISRDLHDVVSHSLTVMIAQSEAARVLTGDQETAQALGRVAQTGRSALQGLRGMLRVLEEDPEAPPAGTQPVPGLGALADLVAAASSPEHRLSFRQTGQVRELAPEAELALYRAAQEALTNAVRHLRPPLSVRVELAWAAKEVRLTVTDDGGAGPREDPGAGTGLLAMTERVRQAGGHLEVQRGNGWSIRVTLPAGAGR